MQPSAELTGTVDAFYRALLGGDAATLAALLSHQEGLLFIGTAPEEWWADYDTIVRVIRAQSELFGSGLRAIGSAPQVQQEGTVGWFADRFTLRLPDGTEVPMRVSGVLHQEAGRWTVVQTHSSLGAPNTEAFRQDFAQ